MDDLSLLKHVGKWVSGTVTATKAVTATCVVICCVSVTLIGQGHADGTSTGAYPLPAYPQDAQTFIRLTPTVAFAFTSFV